MGDNLDPDPGGTIANKFANKFAQAVLKLEDKKKIKIYRLHVDYMK